MDGIDAAQANEGLYLQGSVGTGKTTRATGHLQGLLDRGVPAREILVFLPQRALAEPYREVANEHVGGRVDILTISRLAWRMIQRFWPLVAEDAGFDGDRPPNFLTLETAQYFMSRVTDPSTRTGPAVVSLNGTVASLAVTELLTHITGYRPPNTYPTYDGRAGAYGGVRANERLPDQDCLYCDGM